MFIRFFFFQKLCKIVSVCEGFQVNEDEKSCDLLSDTSGPEQTHDTEDFVLHVVKEDEK
jgi:hypothetical protein